MHIMSFKVMQGCMQEQSTTIRGRLCSVKRVMPSDSQEKM